MKIIFFGDIVGRAGRDALAKHLPEIKKTYKPDALIVNAENAAHGFGITPQIADDLFALGFDVLTSGNHMWDKREVLIYIEKTPALVRPLNYPKVTPGKGYYVLELPGGKRLIVMNAMTRLFMDALDDPFAMTAELIAQQNFRLSGDTYLVMDLHGEASSEKMAFAHCFDGQFSAILGTHTHVPTADSRILPQGTAYQTDLGMCGDYDSVTGFKKEDAIFRFTRKMKLGSLEPATGEGSVSAALVEVDTITGKAISIERVVRGPHLSA